MLAWRVGLCTLSHRFGVFRHDSGRGRDRSSLWATGTPRTRTVDGVMEALEAAISSPWVYLVVFIIAALDAFFPIVPSGKLDELRTPCGDLHADQQGPVRQRRDLHWTRSSWVGRTRRGCGRGSR